MIKFFRHIRKTLLEQNKMGKYFKYAIGEIILVVIGILIALQINNWNEDIKLKREEQKLINDLVVELENNLTRIGHSIKVNDSIYMLTTKVLKGVLDNTIALKSSEVPSLFNYNPYNPLSPILEDVIGSNSRSLISNKKHLEQIQKLDFTYKAVKKVEFYLDELWNDKVTDFFIKTGLGVHMRYDNLTIGKEIIFKADNSFIALLSMINSFQHNWASRLKKTEKTMQEALQILKSDD